MPSHAIGDIPLLTGFVFVRACSIVAFPAFAIPPEAVRKRFDTYIAGPATFLLAALFVSAAAASVAITATTTIPSA